MPRFWLIRLGQFMRRPGKRKRKAFLSPLARYRRLEFEILEARLAPTVVSAFDVSTGLLSVTSDAADTISLAVDAGSGDVLVNGSASLTSGGPAAATTVQQIQISGSAQNNIFDLSQLAGSPFPNATSFIVTGGGGNDTLVGPINQPNTWLLTGPNQGAPFAVSSAVPVAGGSGYAVGDVLTVLGGTGFSAAQLMVEAVDGDGAVTGVAVSNGGGYLTVPENPVSVSGPAN